MTDWTPGAEREQADTFNRAIEIAAAMGTEDGAGAASWVTDGNTKRETYEWLLRGIEDGDPEVLDSLPAPDLSGEWADRMTGPQLVGKVLDEVGIDSESDESVDWFHDICDAYCMAFGDSVQDSVSYTCNYHVAKEILEG